MNIFKMNTAIGLLILLGCLGSTGTYLGMDHSKHMKKEEPVMDHSKHMKKEEPAMDHSMHNMKMDDDQPMDHSAHQAMMNKTGYEVTTESYNLPDATLLDTSGKTVKLNSILNADQPIALNFIFTTCTTICPVMTATFAQMRNQLGDEGANVRLVSITIDPEYDRPDVLKEYAKLFKAGDNWDFLTGDSNTISEVTRGYNAYFGSKMNHKPLTLLKRANSSQWIRIAGLASGADLAKEVKARLLD